MHEIRRATITIHDIPFRICETKPKTRSSTTPHMCIVHCSTAEQILNNSKQKTNIDINSDVESDDNDGLALERVPQKITRKKYMIEERETIIEPPIKPTISW